MTDQEKIQELETKVATLEKEKTDLLEVIRTYEQMNVIQTMNMMITKYEELAKKFKETEEKVKQIDAFMKNESGLNGEVTKKLEEALRSNKPIEEEIVLRGGVSDAFATVMTLMGMMNKTRNNTISTVNNDQ